MNAVKARALPPFWAPADPEDVDVSFTLTRVSGQLCDLVRDGDPLAHAADLDMSLSILDSALRWTISVRAVNCVFVHAGVVRLGDRAMLLPGESFAGKSMLVAALVRRGATYMSDEFAVLSDDGFVHSYPRALSLRVEGEHPLRTVETDPESLGSVETRRSTHVGFIVVTRYRPGASWQPRRLASGEGALALLSHAAAARERPAEVLAAVRRAAAGTVVLVGDRGEATDTAEALMALALDYSNRADAVSSPSARR
jgi:hypothetical protein